MDDHSQINHILDTYKSWECSLFFNESKEKETPAVVDLCQMMQSGYDYIFPRHFFGFQSKAKLVKQLKLSAIQCGFYLDIRTSRSAFNSSRKWDHEFEMSCAAGIAYRKRKDDRKNTEDPTKKKRKYNKSGDKNETTTWLYKDA